MRSVEQTTLKRRNELYKPFEIYYTRGRVTRHFFWLRIEERLRAHANGDEGRLDGPFDFVAIDEEFSRQREIEEWGS